MAVLLPQHHLADLAGVAADIQIRLLERELLDREIMVARGQQIRQPPHMGRAVAVDHQLLALPDLVLLLVPVVREHPLRLRGHLSHMLAAAAAAVLQLAPVAREVLAVVVRGAEMLLGRREQQIRVAVAAAVEMVLMLLLLAALALSFYLFQLLTIPAQ
jgi:hypothetical protein